MKVVGVIGAGAAGLCAARHVAATSNLTPIVWEKASNVGGTWVYTPKVGKDENGLPIHSSMYKHLRTNLPKELMAFPDFPFPSKEESFLHHSEVLDYLERYTAHYSLHQYIKFCQFVEEVKPVEQKADGSKWAVTVRDLETQTSSTTICDALYVCNGHYSVPVIPNIKDIDTFSGVKLHSHDYREAEAFREKRVVLLGAAASGIDICLEVAKTAKEVILSHNHPTPIPSQLPANVRQTPGVTSAYRHGFVFSDGSEADADVIMYCTGYKFTYPFLSDECGVSVENNVVKPLYKHIINIVHPTMAFIGIPMHVVPFPMFDVQVRFFLTALTGDLELPTRQEMEADNERYLQEMKRKGKPEKHFHNLLPESFNVYVQELAAEAHIAPLPAHTGWMFKLIYLRAVFCFYMMKEFQYSVQADGTVQERFQGREVRSMWSLAWLITCRLSHLLWCDFWRVSKFLIGKIKNN